MAAGELTTVRENFALVRKLVERPESVIGYSGAWRWERAVELAGMLTPDQLRILAGVDRPMYNLLQFCALTHTPATAARDVQIREKYPALYEAFRTRFYTAAAQGRWMLEALIIGDMPTSDVRRYYPMQPETAAAYEYMFFDHRHLLRYRAWVCLHLLRPMLSGAVVGDSDVQLKCIAYLGGPEMLMNFVDIRGEFVEEDWRRLQSAVRKHATKNAIAASLSVQSTQYNAIELQDLHLRFEQSVREARQIGLNTSGPSALVQGVVASVRSLFGEQLTVDPATEAMIKEDSTQTELVRNLLAYIDDGKS